MIIYNFSYIKYKPRAVYGLIMELKAVPTDPGIHLYIYTSLSGGFVPVCVLRSANTCCMK